MNRSEQSSLHKLLGELEVEVMEQMWKLEQGGGATVREVASALQQERGPERAIAYTTSPNHSLTIVRSRHFALGVTNVGPGP
jgi:hypothetical protein